jgi:aspartate/methionine/tyrosine aminotransferase
MDDEVRAMWEDLRLGYTESTGHPLLRREIAALYESVEPDDVLVFAGAEEAIFCLLNVLVGPGDHVLVTWPGYQSLYEVARAAGATVGLHALREEDGWALDVDRLRRSIHPNTKAVVVNAPHNPTGMLPSGEEWAELAAACDEAGVVLIADEVYRYLEYDEAERLPAGADVAAGGVSIGVMSKSLAMAGLRIGWLATKDRALLERCAAFKDYTTICSAAPSEILAIAGLRARETVLARSRALVAGNLERIDRLFAERADTFAWVRPRAGSVGFPRLLRDAPIDRFAAELVEAEGVLLLPASAFGFGGDHFRIGLGRSDLPEAVRGLEAFLDRAASTPR